MALMRLSASGAVALVLCFMVASQMEGALANQGRYCPHCRPPRYLRCPNSCQKFFNPKAKEICTVSCATCSSSCKPNKAHYCHKPGAVCYDPRFVGGDGVFFYFHGKANEDFCLVSDKSVHINGHFIGKRPEGRTRDFTWVQGVGILYGSHKVKVSAKQVALWDDSLDQVEVSYDGMPIFLPSENGSSWRSPSGEFKVVRTKEVNAVEMEVTGLLKVAINVNYVSAEDSKVHKYGITEEDCFAHLDLQFSFRELSPEVEGVLGQTYSANYKSPVKVGVPMPIMGGYDKFKSSSLFAADCGVARFHPSSAAAAEYEYNLDSSFGLMPSTSCTSGGENGIVCRR